MQKALGISLTDLTQQLEATHNRQKHLWHTVVCTRKPRLTVAAFKDLFQANPFEALPANPASSFAAAIRAMCRCFDKQHRVA